MDPLLHTSRGSRIEWITLAHSRLGVLRRFGVYLPAGYGLARRRYPVLYLFRGSETEWAGRQDGRPGLLAVLDRAIAERRVGPMVAVLPGFMDPWHRFQGVPVDWSADGAALGVGSGRMADHLFEIKSWVEENLRVRTGPRSTAVDGFSMGGYAAVLLATRYPGLFGSAGAYDGSFMWPDQIDPRRSRRGRADRLWFSETCSPFFRRDGAWDREKMERNNPVTLVARAGGRRLEALKRVRFHVRSAGNERVGNLDRTVNLLEVMGSKGVHNAFAGKAVRLHRRAMHDWRWADFHLEGTLALHDRVFLSDRVAAF